MEFTKEQKQQFLDNLALKTQQGIWMAEISKLKESEKLHNKKALLEDLQGKLERKEFENAREGKNQIKFTESKIAELEQEIQESDISIADGLADLELIERFRHQ